jgi:hypothetical protein
LIRTVVIFIIAQIQQVIVIDSRVIDKRRDARIWANPALSIVGFQLTAGKSPYVVLVPNIWVGFLLEKVVFMV